MKFGEIDLSEAEGAILAHSVRLADGVFKKGRALTAADVAALKAAGKEVVIAARLEPGDVGEDVAADLLARSAVGEGTTNAAPFTGRANIYSDRDGLVVVDEARVNALNALSESITIATVQSFEQVATRQMLATVKIIPFAVPEVALNEALEICSDGGPLVSVAAFCGAKAGLILTRLSQTKDKIIEKSRRSMAQRLEQLGSSLGEVVECDHTIESVSAAVQDLAGQGCAPILLFGASAIVDRGDIIPAGLVKAGGEVVHLGMPVDPGNLMMLGKLGETRVIGVPSCARSPKLNGFDWVLQRTLAGIDVSGADVAAMGAGGLLKEIPSRPSPRERAGSSEAPMAARISGVVLAAGQSRRMGSENKLLAGVGSKPMVRHVVENVQASKVGEVIVVLGHEADDVRAALVDLDVRFVENPDFAEGLSTSLNAGISALAGDVDGVIVCLGDMPLVGPDHINRLISAFDPEEGRGICVPVLDGKRGNPVLWSARYFPEFTAVRGDVGARHLLGQFSEDVCEVELGDRAIMMDVDTPEALASLATDELL